MYGGLFGDLPSAKKQKATSSATPSANAAAKEKTTGTNDNKNRYNESTSSSPSTGEKGGISVAAPASKGNWFAPPRQATAAAKNNNKSQFLQMVGKSGTTMAFVPTAALKSKRKKTAGTTTTNSFKSTNDATEKDGETTKTFLSKADSIEHQSSFAAVRTTTTTTRIAASNPDKAKPTVVVDIHDTGTSDGIGVTLDPNLGTAAADTASSHATDEGKITDLYDPYVPNDLLEYWETLAAKKHREKLEGDTLEALEKQKTMRKQLEEDRKALLQNAIVGVSDAPPRGLGRGRGVSNLPAWVVAKHEGGVVGAAAPELFRGRGRGVSNLPAWLVEKQRKEASNGQ